MALKRLATELDETVRQTREMVVELNDALIALLDTTNSDAAARLDATQRLLVGLQAQDRIEQRCSNIISAIHQMDRTGLAFNEDESDKIWENLSLDELSKPELSGVSAQGTGGDVDLF
ncbi:MAG TPA: hypothetical protein ENJ90_07695 [Devosia sp.]|nr:hypothetical protein [Devosia sp.]